MKMPRPFDLWVIIFLLLGLLGEKASAQQPASDDPALLREIANALQAQRNQALNDVAVLNAMLAKANARIKELEKPPAEPPK